MDAYATHLPVLKAIGAILPIKNVLEVGGGKHSTPLWMDREAFPTINAILVVEDDLEWRKAIREIRGQDTRLIVPSVSDPISVLEMLDLNDFDLIFIDNGRTDTDRIPVIEVIAKAFPKGLVVIHDFEHEPYQIAARGFCYSYIYKALQPHTAMLWNDERMKVEVIIENLHSA